MSETTEQSMSFAEMCNLRRDMCLDRLAKLVSLKAPVSIIANEFSMLFDRMAVCYGEEIHAAVGRLAISHARVAMGFCPYCDEAKGEVRRIIPDIGMCAACRDEAQDENTQEADTE